MVMSLDFLKPVYASEGPYASVVLETGREAADEAAHAIDLRWRGLRTDLATAGADDATLAALDDVVGRPAEQGDEQGQILVAASGTVLLHEHVFRHPGPSVARWDQIPHLLPVLRARAVELSYVLVRTDGKGADVEVRGPAGSTEGNTDFEVEGAEHPLHKVREGGLSHRRIQQRAENTAQQNARLVAEHVDRLVEAMHPDLVVVAGDPRARANALDELAKATRKLTVEIDTSRHAEGEQVEAEVADVVARHVRAEDEELLEAVRAERGEGDRAAYGLDDTVASLRESRVDTLFLEDSGSDGDTPGTRLWASRSDPLAIARQLGELDAMNVEDGFQAAATPVLVRAAAGSEARLALVDPGAVGGDGVCALLRY